MCKFMIKSEIGILFISHCFEFNVSLQAMASTEDKAYEIMRELDVNYVLVIFGGLTGYSSDGECWKFFPSIVCLK